MSQASKPIVVLGSVNADFYVEIDRLPQPGETLDGHGAAIRPGGKGANQAAAAGCAGAPTVFLGQVGRDSHGPFLSDCLTKAQVLTEGLDTVDGPSGQAYILLQAGGENSIIIVGGANQAWSTLSDAHARAIAQGSALLLQREVPNAINMAAARQAKNAGVPVILDVGGEDSVLSDELIGMCDVISPNETELARITGLPTDTDTTVVAAAQSLQARGATSVLVKRGGHGSLLLDPQGTVFTQDVFNVDVVDTTGAGDCFTGVYAVGLVQGLDPQACLRMASAAGALCVTQKGAMNAMPDVDGIQAMLAS